jgi:proteasome lid subunit RPN8/RPN11
MTLILTPAQLEQIIAHAREGKPDEVCGIVRGRGDRASEVIRARNVAEDRVENYTVDPRALLLQFEFEDAGDEMVAIYHSHPVSPPYPSATDAWNANYPDAVYLICSLEDDDAPLLRGWRLITDTAISAEAAPWDVLRATLPFVEVRPALWGYFGNSGSAPPAALERLVEEIAPPFYLVYQLEPDGSVQDERIVTVRECPIEIRP